MAPQATGTPTTWDEDPSGASIVLATGRRQHDLLVIAEPALLTELDEAWGRPASRVRLSFLPGVSAPTAPGQEDALYSYDRGGVGVLVARGRTFTFEGKPARRSTSLVRIAAGAGIRAALIVTRASSLGAAAPGDFLALADHLNLTGSPLFASSAPLEATWDEHLTTALTGVPGVRGAAVAALMPGPLRPSRAEASVLAGLGADVTLMDAVAEGMTLASRGVRTAGLMYVDRIAATYGATTGQHSGGRRAAQAPTAPSQPAPVVVRAAVEALIASLRG